MANRSVNRVTLLGNLGRDAETKFTPSGVARTNFSIATTRRIKDTQTNEWKDETDWHSLVMWRQENLANFLTKGTRVYIEGRLQTRSYDDKDGNKRYMTEVVVEEIILLGGRGEGGDPSNVVSMPRGAGAPGRPAGAGEPGGSDTVTEDDVPF